jgi:hypothetical protein
VIVCLYAISSPTTGRIAVAGMRGEPLRAVAVGSVAAIVGELRRTPGRTTTNLQRYDRTMRALSARVPALLPARYGTWLRSHDELLLILAERQRSLRRGLARVRHRVQMTARVLQQPVEADLQVRSRARATGGLQGPPLPESSGRAYLRRLARDAARARQVAGFGPLRTAVSRWVREERVEKHGRVASVYHLIPRGAAQAYRDALERAARRSGIRVMVSGPWPAYAFADLSWGDE